MLKVIHKETDGVVPLPVAINVPKAVADHLKENGTALQSTKNKMMNDWTIISLTPTSENVTQVVKTWVRFERRRA